MSQDGNNMQSSFRGCRYIPSNMVMPLVALCIGIATGACAWLLKHLIKWISTLLTAFINPDSHNYIFLILPVIGIIIAVVYQDYILHRDISHGVHILKKRLATHDCIYSPRLIFAPLFASAVTLGFGGSAGSEGPIASTGAAVGSNIARLFHCPHKQLGILVACGAGAGIAAIFKAPVGGALFTIEVLAISLDTTALVALFISTVTAALTAFVLSGCTPDMIFNDCAALHWDDTWMVILLGLFIGLYSTYYSFIMRRMYRLYSGISNRWIKALSSGLTVGLLVFLFPTLYGEGYQSVAQLLADSPHTMIRYSWLSPIVADETSASVLLLLFAAALIFVKPFATSSTNSGGGVAGDYAPMLMIGSVAGFLFASTVNLAFGTTFPVVDFVFLGMTGVMAGAVKAPLMAMFLTVEMVHIPSLLLPAAAVASVSWLTRIAFEHIIISKNTTF